METLATKILDLLINGQNAFAGLEIDVLSLRNRFLFALLKKDCSPSEMIDILSQDKSNIAHLAESLISLELIKKLHGDTDKRKIKYSITQKGKDEITTALEMAENKFRNFIDTDEKYDDTKDKFDQVLNILSFL